MDKMKYFFVGTRFYCLEKMLELGLNIVGDQRFFCGKRTKGKKH